MQARRVRYFQMRRWERTESGDLAADCAYVRVCGESDDPRLTRLMQGYCEDKLHAAAAARPARPALDPDIERVIDPRGGNFWD